MPIPEKDRRGPTNTETPASAPPAAPAAHGEGPGAVATQPARSGSRWWIWVVGVVLLAAGAVIGVPWVIRAWNTVSTDDAYVNGHVTFVAPRVSGQVASVLVDDNNRVKKGELLVQLDKEPFQVLVNIAQSAVTAAQSDLVAAQAQAQAILGQTRSLRFALDHAIEDVDNQVALLRSKVATLQSQRAVMVKAQADFDRAKTLVSSGALSKEEFDQRREAFSVAKAKVEEAQQGVFQIRVSLGQPAQPVGTDNLASVPENLNQTFSTVLQAEAAVLQAVAQLGVSDSFKKSPKQLIADFYKRDPEGDIDRIYATLLKEAPIIKQAKAKLEQAKRNLDQANLNLRYCDVLAEIDGVVTRRNVNPGNNVIAGQSLMAVRSLTESLGRRQFQGNPDRRHADWAPRRSRCRYVREPANL